MVIFANNKTIMFYLPNTFLIPSDYEGTLRIVFEEKCGLTPKVENGRQILEFKKNGFLILNTKLNYGINNDFYLVDNKGNRTKVIQISSFKDRVNKIPAIVVDSITKVRLIDKCSSECLQGKRIGCR